MTPEILAQAARIRLLLMDVDGVLTDGKLYNVPGASGEMVETKGFDTQDGIALQWLHWKEIQTGVISGRISPATAERCRQCHFTYIYQGHIEKIPLLQEILERSGLKPEEIAYIGDDLNDLPAFERAGFRIAVADAAEEVRSKADMVTGRRGGRGAVREAIEAILKARGQWEDAEKSFLTELEREDAGKPGPEAVT